MGVEALDNTRTWFTKSELRRVGTAATMIVVCGTVIILGMTMMMGHYNATAHSGPKAVLDGAVIALLIGRRGRWRCLALLGVVYGLVLLLQVGIFYLIVIMALAGGAGALIGRTVTPINRGAAILLAAIVYELIIGLGTPIRIYFGTGGREPLLWSMWGIEIACRVVGAMAGVVLAWRKRFASSERGTGLQPVSSNWQPRHGLKTRSTVVGFRVLASFTACIVPMPLQNTMALGSIALIYLIYALWAGAGKRVIGAFAGLLWMWLIFGLASFAWHRDWSLVLDLARTVVLRFAPLTLASVVLVTTIRPVDLIHFLRRLRIGPIVLIPLSQVARAIPQCRRFIRQRLKDGKSGGMRAWMAVLKVLLGNWARELQNEDDARLEPVARRIL